MSSLVWYKFQPTPEDLVSHFLRKKRLDPSFTDPRIKEVNLYKYRPCELPGLSSIQSEEQVWYFFCTLDSKYRRSGRVSRTAKGGCWKITGPDRDVKAKPSNRKIGIKKTLVFYEGYHFRMENKTNWIMQEYHECHSNKDPLFKGEVVVCRIERKPDKKHDTVVDEWKPSDGIACESGNYVAEHTVSQMEFRLLPNQQFPFYTEDHVAKDLLSEVEPLVHAEWHAHNGCNGLDHNAFSALQMPVYSGVNEVSNVWNTPLDIEQDDASRIHNGPSTMNSLVKKMDTLLLHP